MIGASFLRAASRHALIDEDEMQLTAGIAKPSACARRARTLLVGNTTLLVATRRARHCGRQNEACGELMGWLVRSACLGVVEQIDQRLPGHNARLNRRGQLAVHSLAVSLARDAEVLRKGPALGSAHAHEPRRAPRRAHCRHHRGAGRIALHRDQCHCGEHQYHCGEQSQIARAAGTSMAFGAAFEELLLN